MERDHLDNSRRFAALCLLAIGLYTFFVPLVKIHPVVMGKNEWSAWDITSIILYGKLHASSGILGYLLINIPLQYFLMLIMLLLTGLSFSRYRRELMVIAVLALGCGIEARESGYQFFAGMFFPKSFAALTGAGIEYGTAMIVPSITMAGVILISITEDMDPKYWAKRKLRGE